MANRSAIDEWVIIPIGEQKVLFGRDSGTRTYRITSEILDFDPLSPPRWAATKTGSQYELLGRAATISRYAYAAALDTLLQRGHAADDIAHYLNMAERLIKDYNSDEIVSIFLR